MYMTLFSVDDFHHIKLGTKISGVCFANTDKLNHLWF